MKTINKITALLIILCLLSTPMPAGAWAVKESSAEPYAMVRFDGGENVNVTRIAAYEGAFVYEERDGVQVLKLRRDSGSANFCAVDIKDGLFSDDKKDYVFVTVRYYDEGQGYFGVVYDDNDDDWSSGFCKMTNTHTWKEHTFVLDDCLIRNSYRTGHEDFAVAVWTKAANIVSYEPVYLQWIKVEKGYPIEPKISLTSEHIGNIFDGDDEKVMRLHITNPSEAPMDLKLSYQVLDHDKNFMEDGESWSVSLGAGETAERDIKVGVTRYGCYDLAVYGTCTVEWDGVSHTTEFDRVLLDFSIMNKMTDSDMSNRMMKANAHENYAWADPNLTSELYRDAGISGVRDEWRWGLIEQQKGVYNTTYEFEGGITQDFVPKDIEYGRDMMLILDYGNQLYMPGEKLNNHTFPDNDRFPGSEEGFLNYVEYITSRYGNSVKYYEFWNEANIKAFNTYLTSTAKYTELLKKVYAIVKKNAPESLVVGMATAGVGESFHYGVLEAGGGEYMDAVSFHPYDWSGQFHGDTYKEYIDKVKKIYHEYGYDDMLFLADEIGITAWPESGKWPNEFGTAAESVQYYAMSQAEKLVDAYYIFHFTNTPGSPWALGTQEQRWGMLKSRKEAVPYAAHPAALTTAAFNQVVGNAESEHQYLSEADENGFRTYMYQFKREKDGKDVLMYWTEYGSAAFGIKLGAETAESYDMYSNSEGMLHATDGVFSLNTSFEPRYLVGDFSDFEITAPAIQTNGGRLMAVENDTLTLTYRDAAGRSLRAETVTEDNLTLEENNGIADGYGKLVYHVGDNFINEERVTVKLYDSDDNMVYDGLYHILKSELPVSVSGTAEADAGQRNTVSVTITNTTQGYTLTGDVVMDFTEDGGSKQTRRVVNLASGATATLRFNLPISHSHGAKERQVFYNFDGLEAGCASFLLTPSLTGAYTAISPSVEGEYNRGDWRGGSWFAAKDDYSAMYYGNWTGTRDASFEGTVLWDEENLYLAVEVTDDKFSQNYDGDGFWQGDSVQLGIIKDDGATAVEVGDNLAGTAAFTGIGIFRSPSGEAKLYRYKTQFGSVDVGYADNCVASIKQQDGKWIYRAKIPWSELFGPNRSVSAGEQMRIGLLLNDNDDDGRNYVMFCDGIATSTRANTFTALTLTR